MGALWGGRNSGGGSRGDKSAAFYFPGTAGSGQPEDTVPQLPSPSVHSALKATGPQAGQDTSHRPGRAKGGQEGKAQVHLGTAGMWHKKGPWAQG